MSSWKKMIQTTVERWIQYSETFSVLRYTKNKNRPYVACDLNNLQHDCSKKWKFRMFMYGSRLDTLSHASFHLDFVYFDNAAKNQKSMAWKNAPNGKCNMFIWWDHSQSLLVENIRFDYRNSIFISIQISPWILKESKLLHFDFKFIFQKE